MSTPASVEDRGVVVQAQRVRADGHPVDVAVDLACGENVRLDVRDVEAVLGGRGEQSRIGERRHLGVVDHRDVGKVRCSGREVLDCVASVAAVAVNRDAQVSAQALIATAHVLLASRSGYGSHRVNVPPISAPVGDPEASDVVVTWDTAVAPVSPAPRARAATMRSLVFGVITIILLLVHSLVEPVRQRPCESPPKRARSRPCFRGPSAPVR